MYYFNSQILFVYCRIFKFQYSDNCQRSFRILKLIFSCQRTWCSSWREFEIKWFHLYPMTISVKNTWTSLYQLQHWNPFSFLSVIMSLFLENLPRICLKQFSNLISLRLDIHNSWKREHQCFFCVLLGVMQC